MKTQHYNYIQTGLIILWGLGTLLFMGVVLNHAMDRELDRMDIQQSNQPTFDTVAPATCHHIEHQLDLDRVADGRDIEFDDGDWYVEGTYVGSADAEDEPFTWCE